MDITRPKFIPETLQAYTGVFPLVESDDPAWVQVLSAKCHFGLNVFLSTLKELSIHPERNSSLILRAEDIQNPATPSPSKFFTPPSSYELSSHLHLQLLPKVPKRDSKLVQHCLFYRTPETSSSDHHTQTAEQGLVVLVPDVQSQAEIPYYHPDVRKLAFHYEALPPAVESAEVDDQSPVGVISISVLPWPQAMQPGPLANLQPPKKPARKRSPLAGPPMTSEVSTPVQRTPPPAAVILDQAEDLAESVAALSHSPVSSTDKETDTSQPNKSALPDRLYRTCLGLLDRLHKHGYGNSVGYKKRREHDVLVDKSSFQDLYLTLKERHRHLDSRLPSSQTSSKFLDTKRHVFKCPGDEAVVDDWSHWGQQDVALAAFLMLLWKDMYPAREVRADEDKPWDTWGRPSSGFVDLGCGNALLVHILLSEGYDGKGLELRARKTWPLYPESTQAALLETGINPPEWFPETIEQWEAGVWHDSNSSAIKEGVFLIGNHADEMTPWLPLLSLLPSTPVPHLSLPCCLHTLSSHFTQSTFVSPPGAPDFSQGLEDGESRYKAYIMWLAWCGWKAGWSFEKEPLRVPSTRGWAIIARNRVSKDRDHLRECRLWALEQVNEVRRSGGFTVREKEGNQH